MRLSESTTRLPSAPVVFDMVSSPRCLLLSGSAPHAEAPDSAAATINTVVIATRFVIIAISFIIAVVVRKTTSRMHGADAPCKDRLKVGVRSKSSGE